VSPEDRASELLQDSRFDGVIYTSEDVRHLNRIIAKAICEAVLDEREACAKLCDLEVELAPGGLGGRAYMCAKAIRKRGKP